LFAALHFCLFSLLCLLKKKNVMLLIDIMKKTTIIIIITVMLIVGGCQTGREKDDPVIQSISPEDRAMHLPAFTLTVRGDNFKEGAEIFFNDIRKTTERISSTELRCALDPSELEPATATGHSHLSATSDNVLGSVQVYVVNYESSGQESERSNSVEFSILEHPRFNEPVILSNLYNWVTDPPSIAVDSAGVIHVVWNYSEEVQKDDFTVVHRRSTDSGETWEEPRDVNGRIHCYGRDEIAAGGDGYVYIVFLGWENAPYQGKFGVYFTRSPDHGLTWEPPIWVSNPEDSAFGCNIGANSHGEVAVVWNNLAYGERRDIFLTRSGDHGASWSNIVNVSDNIGSPVRPAVEINDEGAIYVVWEERTFDDREIFFRRSRDHGNSWRGTVNISDDDYNSFSADITCDTAGQPFVTFDEPLWSQHPAIALDVADNVNIAWNNYHKPFYPKDVMFSRSIDQGYTWSGAVKVSRPAEDFTAGIPSIAVDREGHIYVVWYQRIKFSVRNYQIVFCSSK
jgi:hypothetical protein